MAPGERQEPLSARRQADQAVPRERRWMQCCPARGLARVEAAVWAPQVAPRAGQAALESAVWLGLGSAQEQAREPVQRRAQWEGQQSVAAAA